MWKEGVISIPADIARKVIAVHYWVKHYSAWKNTEDFSKIMSYNVERRCIKAGD